MTLLILYAVISIFFSFLCSILEAVLLSVTPTFVNIKSKEGKPYADNLKALKQTWQENIANIELPLEKLNADILQLKKRRKNLSNKLQKIIFKQSTIVQKTGFCSIMILKLGES